MKIKKYILLILLILPIASAEYFETDIIVKYEIETFGNLTYYKLNVTTENKGDSFSRTNITSNIDETFTLTIWRKITQNQTEFELLLDRFENDLEICNFTEKGEFDYFLGHRSEFDNFNETYLSYFSNIDYKAQKDACETQKTSLNNQMEELRKEKDKKGENNFLYALGAAGIIYGFCYYSWKMPRKTKQPGAKDYPDVGGKGNVKW